MRHLSFLLMIFGLWMLILFILIFIITLFCIPLFRAKSPDRFWLIGLLWLALTLVFEFGFGWYGGLSLTALFQDYNVFEGRLWPLVLLSTLLSPVIAGRLRGSK